MKDILEDIEKLHIKKLDIDLEEGGNFIYHEGILLAHYFNKNNTREHYLYKWCDTDKIINRWLLYKVSEEDLVAFLNKKLSSLELIQKNQFSYFIDIDGNFEHKQILLCAVENIPKSYLPKETAYFNEEFYEDYAKELRNKLLSKSKGNILYQSRRAKGSQAVTQRSERRNKVDFSEEARRKEILNFEDRIKQLIKGEGKDELLSRLRSISFDIDRKKT